MNLFKTLLVTATLTLGLATAAGCSTEVDDPSPSHEAQTQGDELPAVDTNTTTPDGVRPCIPQKLPICTNGFSCYCASSGYRVCICN